MRIRNAGPEEIYVLGQEGELHEGQEGQKFPVGIRWTSWGVIPGDPTLVFRPSGPRTRRRPNNLSSSNKKLFRDLCYSQDLTVFFIVLEPEYEADPKNIMELDQSCTCKLQAVLRIRILDPKSGAFSTPGSWIWDG